MLGGIAKIAIRREIGNGGYLEDAEDMVKFLKAKFHDKNNPAYIIKEIDTKHLEMVRTESRCHEVSTIKGSSLFQVIVFTPGEKSLRVAPRLCACNQCMVSYGSCDLFSEHPLLVKTLNQTFLRSNVGNNDITEDDIEVDDDDNYSKSDFLVIDSVCAVATDVSSSDTVWFIKITDDSIAVGDIYDDYQHKITAGQHYLEGHYLEKHTESRKGQTYTLMNKKKVFFFQESVVYPFVQCEEKKGKLFISNESIVEILYYVENNGLSSI